MKSCQIKSHFMPGFNSLCQNYNSLKVKIKYSWRGREKEITLPDILPKNFCILAFHSLYAYMQTFFTGGWFNWVKYDENVIVTCPAPEGIAMYLKPYMRDPAGGFQIVVMKATCKCYKGYKLKDSFFINFNEEDGLKYEMLDRIIPFFAGFVSKACSPGDFCCTYKGDTILYQIELD